MVVAHGSRDPRSAATIRTVTAGLGAYVSFLDLSEPLLTDVLRSLRARGHSSAVVVPLLLGRAYHARVDLPALVKSVPGLSVRIADVLGPDPVLQEIALDRLTEVGADLSDPSLGVILAGVGSSHAPANEAVAEIARRWSSRFAFRATAAFASAAKPDIPAAMAKLRARGARRFAVASWFLAPGLLPDRIASLARAAEPSVLIADSLAPEPRIGDLILGRYESVLAAAA